MRILLLPLGSQGDVNPFIGLGLALQKRGHDVVVVTNAHFEPNVKQAGLGFSSCGAAKAYLNLYKIPPGESGLLLFFRFCLASIPEAFSRIKQLCQPGNTVMVAQPHVFAARIAQESLGIPMATVTLSPGMFRTAYSSGSRSRSVEAWLRRWRRRMRFRRLDKRVDKVLAPGINAFRARLGLKPARRLWGPWPNSPERVIGLWPEWLHAPQPDWPANAVATGFIGYDGPPTAGAIPWSGAAGERSEQRPIIITATTNLDPRDFFSAACGACEILNRPGLVLTHQEEMLPKPLPPMVRYITYTPFGEILPRAAAIVHHGGIGTAARALKAGIPQLIMPFGYDQFDNAGRIVRLGVARSIQRKGLTSQSMAARLRELLQSDTVLERCRMYARKFENDNALETTCDYIEALSSKEPVRRRGVLCDKLHDFLRSPWSS